MAVKEIWSIQSKLGKEEREKRSHFYTFFCSTIGCEMKGGNPRFLISSQSDLTITETPPYLFFLQMRLFIAVLAVAAAASAAPHGHGGHDYHGTKVGFFK